MTASDGETTAGSAAMRGVPAEQEAVVRCLADPASYPHAVERVARHDTHAAMVFLAGPYAYKIKRAVAYPYLDFSTLDRRRAVCRTEIARNRRTAPSLYLGLCPIRRTDGGGLALGEVIAEPGPGDASEGADVVEVAVVMRRFDQADLLADVAERGDLSEALLDALAETVAAFHDGAEPVTRDVVAAQRAEIGDTTGTLRTAPDVAAAADVDALERRARAALDGLADRLAGRAAAGLVRRCHGDLHLGNIVLLDGAPTPFDCIEFNDALAEIDVLDDLAFLLMDLDRRGRRAAANRVLNRYLGRRDDLDGLAALPLFLALRAGIRAKVGVSALATVADAVERAQQAEGVRAYLDAALGYLDPPRPVLVAVGGLSGTGKTTVARAIAPEIGGAPGALVVRSDVERKRLFGVAETEPLPESAYQGRANAQVYARMLARAQRALQAGHSVVLEATFLRREDRAQVRKLAEETGVPAAPIWLTAPAETLKARVDARAGDASDATSDVVAQQLERAPKGAIPWPSVDASGTVRDAVARARAALRAADVPLSPTEDSCDGSA